MTYGGQGVAKRGVTKEEHAIIHTGRIPPHILFGETPARGERGMLASAVRVDADENTEKLDPVSRIDFGKLYTIHHNVKVRSIGMVNRASMNALHAQFKLVWQSTMGDQKLHTQAVALPAELSSNGQSPTASESQWTKAYTLLRANGFTAEEARSVLKAKRKARSLATYSQVSRNEDEDGDKDNDGSSSGDSESEEESEDETQ